MQPNRTAKRESISVLVMAKALLENNIWELELAGVSWGIIIEPDPRSQPNRTKRAANKNVVAIFIFF